MTTLLKRFDGRKILLAGIPHEVRGEILGRPAVQLRSPDGVIHEISIDEFRLQQSLGNVLSNDGKAEGGRLSNSEELREVRFRAHVIRLSGELEAQGLSWRDRISLMREKLSQDPDYLARGKPFPTARTIQMWRRLSLMDGRSALADKRFRSGNRADRHDELFEEIVYDLVETQYAGSDRKTVRSLAQDAKVLYMKVCRANRRKPLPHGERVVRSLIDRLPHADIVKRRLGTAEARKALLQAGRFQTVSTPLERIEIDSTQADTFIVIDRDGHVARPTICAAIDCATGVIVGLQVSISAPSSLLTALTLREIMTPKPDEFFEKNKIQNRFQAFGRPLAVVTDQGSENAGDLIESCIRAASLELRKNIPGHPEKKPYVERFFGTLKHFLRTLPGATSTSTVPDGARTKRAMREARLTFEQFVEIVERWRFDVYSVRPQRRIQSALRTTESPGACWKRLQDEYLVPEPPSERELREMFLAGTANRVLHRYGIEFEMIQYSSKELRDLFGMIGSGQRVEIRFDPTDIRTIAVFNPLSREHIIVAAKEKELPAISFAELKEIRRRLAPDAQCALSAHEVLRAISEGMHEPVSSKQRTAHREAGKRAARVQADKSILERSRKASAVETEIATDAHAAIAPLRRPRSLVPLNPKVPK